MEELLVETEHYSVADNLMAFCASSGMTQREIARASGLPEATISRWCTGVVTRPRPALLRTVSEALGVPYEHFVSPDAGYAHALALVNETKACLSK